MHQSDRYRRIMGPVDVATQTGLEIGPLTCPIVRKCDGDVLYVDFADTETVRAKPYHPSINPADIVDVDIEWTERPLVECVGHQVDYVIASHVIEHVPDIVGWLLDLHAVVKPGGWIGLAIPDRRFTFDYPRNESTVGEMIEAYLLRYRRPSIRQIFDHCHLTVVNDVNSAWTTIQDSAKLPCLTSNALHLAYDQAVDLARSPRYIDSHCWVFTPDGFLRIAAILAELDLFPFEISIIHPTQRGTFEFLVGLQPAADQTLIMPAINRAKAVVASNLDELHYQGLMSGTGAMSPPNFPRISRTINV